MPLNESPLFISVFLVSFLISLVCVRFFISVARKRGLIDRPNERSSHTIPTPRGGGAVIVMAWAAINIGMLFINFEPRDALALMPGALLVAWIGFLDDRSSITAGKRALVQCVAAGMLAVALLPVIRGDLFFAALLLGFALFATVWSVNLFNFMDGIDGIAGIEALFVFAVGTWALAAGGAEALALSAIGVVGLVAGFLWWNWPPAKIFMGDVGSGFLGFLITAYAFAGYCFYNVSLIPWVVAYLVFVFDTSITLIKRTAQRENIFTAHRSHYYQNLHHIKKWSHQRVDALVVVANIVLGALAIACIYWPELAGTFLGIAVSISALGFFSVSRYLKSAAV